MKHLLFLLFGALGLWLGMPNAYIQLPLLVLLYPAALYLLGLESESRSEAFRRGWLCGLLGASACLYWIAIPIHDFGGQPWFLAVPCALLMGAYVGLYGGVFATLVHLLRRESLLRQSLLLGLAWYLLECFRGWFGTGFPWLSLSTAFVPWPEVIQTASLIGGYGLSGLFAGLTCLLAGDVLMAIQAGGISSRFRPLAALVACGLLIALFTWVDLRAGVVMLYVCGAFLSWLFRREHMPWGRHILGTLLCCFVLFTYSFLNRDDVEHTSAPAVPVALIQGSLDQNVKWEPTMQRLTIQRYLELSREALQDPAGGPRPRLLIWPETSMPFDYERQAAFAQQIRTFARDEQVAILFGAPGFRRNANGSTSTFNRAILIQADGTEGGMYEKRHLVPFGEYMPPFLDVAFLRPLLQGIGDFTPGEHVAPLKLTALQNPDPAQSTPLVPGMLICYEAIFPELSAMQTEQGANVLINISNDAWFGRSAAPEQHLQQSIVRAVEQGRWLLRSTNTGISAIVSPTGKILARSGLFRPEVVQGTFSPRSAATLYSLLGPWLLWGALVAFLLCFPWRSLKKTPPVSKPAAQTV